LGYLKVLGSDYAENQRSISERYSPENRRVIQENLPFWDDGQRTRTHKTSKKKKAK
jgi:hypothetical protein